MIEQARFPRFMHIITRVVMDATLGSFFFKPEKNLEFFRLKNDPIDGYPGRLE